MSPFGAVRRKRGLTNPLANSWILKPAGTRSCAPAGRRTTRGPLFTDFVAKGGGKSASVILWRTPGASWVQSAVAEALRAAPAPCECVSAKTALIAIQQSIRCSHGPEGRFRDGDLRC